MFHYHSLSTRLGAEILEEVNDAAGTGGFSSDWSWKVIWANPNDMRGQGAGREAGNSGTKDPGRMSDWAMYFLSLLAISCLPLQPQQKCPAWFFSSGNRTVYQIPSEMSPLSAYSSQTRTITDHRVELPKPHYFIPQTETTHGDVHWSFKKRIHNSTTKELAISTRIYFPPKETLS